MALPYSPELFFSHSMLTKTFLFLITIPFSASLEFHYPTLNKQNPDLISTRGNTSYLGDSEIQLTSNQKDQIGRLRYFQPMRLWDISSAGRVVVADFTTQFSFTIHSDGENPGDGIAFFLAQPPFDIPDVTYGPGLGLVSLNDQGITSSVNDPFVEVEFETFKNSFNRPDLREHVGINVNSLISKEAAPWPCNFRSWPSVAYNASISYNSNMLSVVFTGYDSEISRIPIERKLSYEINLSGYLPEWVVFGFSATNRLNASNHVLRSWSFDSEIGILESNHLRDPNLKLPVPERTAPSVGDDMWFFGFDFGGLIGLIFVLLRKEKNNNRGGKSLDLVPIASELTSIHG